ncbi:MAG: hypothetical protein K0Q73_5546 [Paenibacillus sp.]|nr:hypothetical protein [Paenibacillus sp.]
MNAYIPGTDTLLQKYKFIVDEVDTDKGFDNFVVEMNKVGLEKAAAEAQEVYKSIKK